MNTSATSNFTNDGAVRSGCVKPYITFCFSTLKVSSPAWPLIIFFGMITNTINITVFLKAGARDNVTILLLCLAMSDITFLTLMTPSIIGFVIESFASPYSWPFDKAIFILLLYWPSYVAYDLSIFISVSLGLMRCACVTLPLKFKFLFTKSRTIKWAVFLVFLAVAVRLPVLTMHRVGWKKDPETNAYVSYLLAVNISEMSRIDDVLNRTFFTYVGFTTMVLCVIILSYKLYEASKIRQSSTAKVVRDPTNSDKSTMQRLSAKDIQVIQSVTLVCFMFSLAQLPFLFASLTRLINPKFADPQRLRILFSIFSQMGLTCSFLNASLNIFVYYRYNSSYRAAFRALILGNKDKNEEK